MTFPSLRKGAALRVASVSLVTASALVIGNSAGVFAALTATTSNPAGQSVSSGTLSLTMASGADSAGFSTSITNLAPGDSESRYVDLTNGGSLDAQSLTLAIAATGDAALVTDGVSPVTTKALTVTVASCSVPWTVATGVCSGTASTEIPATTLSDFSTAQGFGNGDMATLEVRFLKITTTLPDQDEVTVDGAAPANTVQGKSASLVFTFSEAQRNTETVNG